MKNVKFTKDQVVAILVKNGNNPEESVVMVEQEWDFVTRCYPDATIKQAANIIRTVY